MLALSRKKNEAIIISNNIEITILEVKGEQVKIGIFCAQGGVRVQKGSIFADSGGK